MHDELLRYGPLLEEEWLKLAHILKPVRFNKGEYFVQIGDVPNKLGYISSGIFRVFCITEKGEDWILAFREENRFLGAFSPFLESKPSWYGIQALEPSLLLCISLNEYNRLIAGHPCWANLSRKYLETLFVEKEKREREFLSENAETRYLNFKKAYPGIEQRVHQYHIASYLGITSVALSNIRRGLQQKK
jgi:CRP-like cAMP-binding protein